MKTTQLTTTHIARILARGIKANFAPPNQDDETRRLVGLLQDLAMARDGDKFTAKTAVEGVEAANDSDWLDDLARELEATM